MPNGLPVGTGKVIPAQARNRGRAIKAEIAFQICFYLIQHTQESTSIKPSSSRSRNGLEGLGTVPLVNPPCHDALGERLGQQLAGRCFSLQLRRNGARHLAYQWIYKSLFVSERAERGFVNIDTELAWGELARVHKVSAPFSGIAGLVGKSGAS